MSVNADPDEHGALVHLLAEHSMFIYLVGLVAIGIPLVLAQLFDVELGPTARYVIVGTSLAVMIAAYVAERRVGFDAGAGVNAGASASAAAGDAGAGTAGRREYPLRTRLGFPAAILGFAVGLYVAIEVNLVFGAIFMIGGSLFLRLAYKDLDEEDDGE